jgi:plastocyanin
VRVAAAALTVLVVGVQPAGAKDAHVDANGNPFQAGSLNFDPAKVSVNVGDRVHWRNTDQFVPHTSTEDHGLWQLSGGYGSPGPFQGYGPGETVDRAFEAGTHRYYCEVHPEDMRAVVEVPVTLKRLRSGKRRRVRVTWSRGAPADGLVFDVQRRRKRGPWRKLADGTTSSRKAFRLGPRGTRWRVRARLRSAEDAAKATDWSPVASLRS